MDRSSCLGFTLIELLVVIAIIAVLIAPCSCPPCSRPAKRPAAFSAPTTSSRSAWPCTTTTLRRAAFRRGPLSMESPRLPASTPRGNPT